MDPLPLRVTLLPGRLQLPPGWERFEQPVALLVFTAVFEHLVRHPRISLTDPDDFRITDPEGALLGPDHPRIANVKAYELFENRRDELLRIDLGFHAPGQTSVRLSAERFGAPQPEEHAAIAGARLSDAISSAISQWLSARGLGPSPRPIDAFSDEQLLGLAQQLLHLIELRAQSPQAPPQVPMPPFARVPFLRAAAISLGVHLSPTVLQLEPDNPWALRDDHIARAHSPEGAPRDELRRIVALAPGWGKPYGLMWGKGVPEPERVEWASINATLLPANPIALSGYAQALRDNGRRPEALRGFQRASQLAPDHLGFMHSAMETLREMGRPGTMYWDAVARLGYVQDLLDQQRYGGAEPDLCMCRLDLSNAFFDIGRLDEAIRVRGAALQRVWNPDSWPRMTKILETWKSDATAFAHAYGREGYFRGDYGRAVEGSAKGVIDDYDQLIVLVESLLAIGEPRLALLAFAQSSRRGPAKNVGAQLAGAHAMLANGALAPAATILAQACLRAPQHRYELGVARLLRLGAAFDASDWGVAIAPMLEAGARTVARLVARDAADFVPGADHDPTIQKALAGAAPIAFDPRWLDALRQALGAAIVDPVDRFFEAASPGGDLASADSLVARWTELAPLPAQGASADEARTYGSRVLHTLASALTRYLALTTQRPSPIAGALRTIALEALSAMHDRPVRYSDPHVRALLLALEPVMGLEPWLVDTWLHRVQRALDLETSRGAHLAHLVEGLPRTASMLRGDERVALELRSARAASAAGDRARALPLWERSVRAVGGNFATSWAEAIVGALDARVLSEADALDALWTAYHANPLVAGAAVELGKRLLPSRPELALDVLSSRLGWASGDWKTSRLAQLRPLWSARTGVPFEFDAAQSGGYQAMQAGRFAEAVRAYRWCAALDAGNTTALRNLGMCQARLGDAVESVASFAEADALSGPLAAAQQLYHGGHPRSAIRCYQLAVLGNAPPEVWQQYAAIAYAAEDDEAAADAYEGLYRLTGGRLDAASLNALAGVLDNLGRYDRCEEIARQLAQIAGSDRTMLANANHHLACAMLGRGRGAEGVQPAMQALQLNTVPENQPLFQETLQRCQSGQPRPPTAAWADSPAGRAFATLRASEIEKARAAGASSDDWGVRRAAMAAWEFRFESENEVVCSPGAVEYAAGILRDSEGSTDVDAILARNRALRLREARLFPVDPRPNLGSRVSDADFRARLGLPSSAGGAASAPAGGGADADREVFPGTRLPRVSDYAALMKGIQRGDFQGALARAGLDAGSYAQLAGQWSTKLQQDPALMRRFQELVTQP